MRIVKFLIATIAMMIAFVACNKEKDKVSITVDRSSLYFSSWSDEGQTVSYLTENAVSVAIGSYSDGLHASVHTPSQTIYVKPIGTTDKEVELPKVGYVVVIALEKDNESVSCYINVYVSETQYLDSDESRANCYKDDP